MKNYYLIIKNKSTLEIVENQNFRNNQNYVFGKLDKAKIYSLFLGQIRKMKFITIHSFFVVNLILFFIIIFIILFWLDYNGVSKTFFLCLIVFFLLFIYIFTYSKAKISAKTLKKIYNEKENILKRTFFISAKNSCLECRFLIVIFFDIFFVLIFTKTGSNLFIYIILLFSILVIFIKIRNIFFYLFFLFLSNLIYYFDWLKSIFGLNGKIYILHPKYLNQKELEEITDKYIATKGYLIIN